MKKQIMQYVNMLVLSGISVFPPLALAGTQSVAGEVSLSIGVSRVVRTDGTRINIERGIQILRGDRIETEDGGHVHIRFIDGAYVSVRPGSRLEVEAYQYNAEKPEENAIRFRLDQGVARSITGRGGEAAKERFRLNTPIAAIGVKGTDFVVQVVSDSVRVAVNSGAIVMAPLDDLCRANSLGPCNTAFARTLSADMGRVAMEFQRQQDVPRLVPINGQPVPERLGSAPTSEDTRGLPPRRTDASTEALAAQTVIDARNNDTTQVPVETPPAENKPDPVVKPPDTPIKIDPPSNSIVELPPVQAPTKPATLVWGRWSWIPALPEGTATVSYAEARSNGERESTLGNIALASLMRPLSDKNATLPKNLGIVSFTMRDSEAYLLKNGTYSAGRVTDGWLRVDFGARKFDTNINAEHVETGQVNISATGNVDSKGIFLYNNPTTYVGGALTLDGQEAGLHFERKLTQGSLLGLTRWYK